MLSNCSDFSLFLPSAAIGTEENPMITAEVRNASSSTLRRTSSPNGTISRAEGQPLCVKLVSHSPEAMQHLIQN